MRTGMQAATAMRAFASAATAAVTLCAGMSVAGAAPAESDAAGSETGPGGGAAGQDWTATHDGPQQYPQVHAERDVPITMSDGTELKADVYRPADASGAPVDDENPVVVNMTPYTKLVSNLADAALSIPELEEPVMDFARGLNETGTPLEGVTDLVKTISGGGLRLSLIHI